MKRLSAILLALVMVLSLAACGSTQTAAVEEAAPAVTVPFEVGEDTATYTVDGSSSYAGTATANVKIVADEDVLFNGKVTVTSDSLWVNEFIYAAVDELGISQAGIQEGFITSIGDYVCEGDYWWLWEYNGNNPTNFSVNQVHVFDGDYILVTFVDYNEYYSVVTDCAVKHDAFEVGEDTATYTVDGSSSYAGTATANVKIVAGEDVLFNGKVTVTSDNLWVNEYIYAAIDELGISQAGVQEGFITSIGDYVCEGDYWWMWESNGNNPTNFSINDVHVFEGDYILVTFVDINEYYSF